MDDIWSRVSKHGVGFRKLDDPFFREGNKFCRTLDCRPILDEDSEEFLHNSLRTFNCQAPACLKTFNTLLEYELHYNSYHRYTCITCKKSLPTSHLLELHIMESHDALFKTAAMTRPMFRCFLEMCQDVFSDAKERKDHCIKQHKFPGNFSFDTRCAPKKAKPKSSGVKTKAALASAGASTAEMDPRSLPTYEMSIWEENGQNGADHLATSDEARMEEDVPPAVITKKKTRPKKKNNKKREENKMDVCQPDTPLPDSPLTPLHLTSSLDLGSESLLIEEMCDAEAVPSPSAPHLSNAAPHDISPNTKHPIRIKYSYKVPEKFCFGFGAQKGFERRRKPNHWYQQKCTDQDTGKSIEDIDIAELGDCLN